MHIYTDVYHAVMYTFPVFDDFLLTIWCWNSRALYIPTKSSTTHFPHIYHSTNFCQRYLLYGEIWQKRLCFFRELWQNLSSNKNSAGHIQYIQITLQLNQQYYINIAHKEDNDVGVVDGALAANSAGMSTSAEC